MYPFPTLFPKRPVRGKKFLLFQFWSAPLQELHSDGEEYFGVATGGERGENGCLAGGSQIGSENPKKR